MIFDRSLVCKIPIILTICTIMLKKNEPVLSNCNLVCLHMKKLFILTCRSCLYEKAFYTAFYTCSENYVNGKISIYLTDSCNMSVILSVSLYYLGTYSIFSKRVPRKTIKNVSYFKNLFLDLSNTFYKFDTFLT